MLHISINGVALNDNEVSGLKKTRIKASRTGSGGYAKAVTSELELTGAAWAYIVQEFVNNPNATTHWLPVVVTDDCCDDQQWAGRLTFKGVKFCDGECKVKITVTEPQDALDCIKSTTIADNWNNFQNTNGVTHYHPVMRYCNEMRPNGIQDLLIIYLLLWNLQLLILTPVVFIISVMIQAFCWLLDAFEDVYEFFGGDPADIPDCPPELADGLMDEFNSFIDAMNTWALGCGRGHPSPLIRDYITNVCNKCGIGFQSSILNDSSSLYYNSVYMNAPTKKGCVECSTHWIADNEPYKMLDMFLDDIKQPFNADWVIKNNVLIFERHDLLKNQIIAFDFTAEDKPKLKKGPCYEWDQTTTPAYDNIGYSKDGIDIVGDEASALYNDIIDYNNPIANPSFVGERKKTFPFGATRFRSDGVERDVLTSYEFIVFYGGVSPQDFDGQILMAQGTSLLPKILIWDGGSNTDMGYVVHLNHNGGGSSSEFPPGWYPFYYNRGTLDAPPGQLADMSLYNYPMMVDAQFSTANFPNLWEFHKIDASTSTVYKHLRYTLEFYYVCSDIPKLDLFSSVKLAQGIGSIDSWEIDFNERKIILSGKL